jgi:helicase
MEWLAYSASELSRLSKLNRVFLELKKLETRIKYGISGELMPLVTVKGIGRVRARKLYAAGITSPEKLRAEEPRKLTLLLGEKTAKKILEELQDTPYVVD